MLLQQAGKVRWKKWAAKHEYEELKEGVGLGPVQAMLRRKNQCVVDREAPNCDEEASDRGRMGAEE